MYGSRAAFRFEVPSRACGTCCRNFKSAALDRRAALGGALALGAAALLPRAGRAQPEPRRGGVLRWAIPPNPGSLDPVTGRTAAEFAFLHTVFDALLDFDPMTLDPKPGLAKSFAFEDATTFVLDLVEGVSFHDGTPFDADAVKFNLDRARSDPRSNVRADIATVRAVETAGKHRVILRLDRPNAALPAILSDRPGMMISPAHIKQNGNVDQNPVGTGPWKLVSWRSNDRFVATRNENYWRPGLPYLDGINIAIMNEPATALRSVMAGENDIATSLGPQQKSVADRSKLVTQLTHSLGMVGIYLNYSRPPLSDVRIRQALNYAIDRDALNQAVAAGLDVSTSAVLPQEHWACDPATAQYYRHDPDMARKLLADAGFAAGIDVPMLGWSDQISMQRQEVIVTQLARSGVRVKLTPVSASASSTMFFGPAKQGAGRMAQIAARPDPSQEYDNLFSKDAYFNAGAVELPGYRPLLDATMATTDLAQRKAAFAKLQRFVVENALLVPIVFNTAVTVHHPRVNGFVLGMIGKPKCTDVWLDA
jgi:ABC-type transport system substrate-binding protein